MYRGLLILVVLVLLGLFLWGSGNAESESQKDYGLWNMTLASWYGEKECARVNPSLLMANGVRYDESKLTVASWDYPFGTRLWVINVANNKSVITVVKDRGPQEVVHHINEIVNDNRIENLQLMVKREHDRYHTLKRYREVLR